MSLQKHWMSLHVSPDFDFIKRGMYECDVEKVEGEFPSAMSIHSEIPSRGRHQTSSSILAIGMSKIFNHRRRGVSQ